jgi:predicted nucleic acid-binding protein
MTVLIDSWAWIEYWKGGPCAKAAAVYIEGNEEAVVSTINVAEIYYWVLKSYDAENAMKKVNTIQKRCQIIPAEKQTAIEAAKAKKQYGLALADSLIYATAREFRAKLITGDSDLKNLEGTVFLRK